MNGGDGSKERRINATAPSYSQGPDQTSSASSLHVNAQDDVNQEANGYNAMIERLIIREQDNSVKSSRLYLHEAVQDEGDQARVIDLLLRVLQRWTIRTGDTSVLQSLLRNVSLLDSSRQCHPYRTSGHPHRTNDPESSVPSTDNDVNSGHTHPSALGTSNPKNHYGEGSAKEKNSTNQVRPSIKLAHMGPNNPTRLRCPLFFVEGDHGCKTLHNCIRDLM